jgi:hypothetical protein
MKRTLLFMLTVLSVAASYAVTLSADKVFTMSNHNDNNLYVKDTGNDIIGMGGLDNTCYWRFIPTGTPNMYYVQNTSTGRYAQMCSTDAEVNVTMGKTPVAYSVVDCSAQEGADCFGLTSENAAVKDFTAGAIGWNWKNDNTVQTFAAEAGTNHRSFWKFTEYDSPYVGAEPAEGDFYLYNVATGKWLGDNHTNNNGSWTSHGELGPRGRDIQLVAFDDGYRLNPKLGHNHSINGNNLYMDTNDPQTKWTFTKVEGLPNAYKITAGDFLLGADGDGNLSSSQEAVFDDVWQLVSKQERENYDIAIATEENPADMSWVVLGGTFPVADDHRSNGTWQGNIGDNNNGGDGFVHCNRVWEMWNITNKDVYQVIHVPNGKYQVDADAVFSPTAGDRVSAAHYDAFIAGTEPTLGKVYANDKSVLMTNIYELVTDEKVLDRNTMDLGNGKWAYRGPNEFSTNIFEGKGGTEKITLNVTDGTLRVGVRVENANNAWIVFDNFRVHYLGQLTGTDAFLEDLNNAIAAGENCTTPTTEALKNALDEAVANGKDKLTSESADEISAATAAINNLLNTIKGVAETYQTLSKTVEVVTLQNNPAVSDVTEALTGASNVLKTAMTAEEIQDALKSLKMVRRLAFGGRHADVFKGTEPADGVEAYIYNVGAGLYLAGSNDWGTHASLNYASRTMILHANTAAENCYDIRTNLPNGLRGTNDWLGHNGYVDCGGHKDNDINWGWIFEPVGDGSYRIINAQNSGDRIYLGMTEDDRLQVDTDKSGADNKYNHWKLVTVEELEELLDNASEDSPADATYYIHQSTFSQNDFDGDDKGAANGDLNDTPWERNAGSIWNWKNHSNVGDYIYEMWNTGVQEDGPVYLQQTISGLKPGKYVASVSGYYRDGSFANAVEVYLEPEQWAYLTANDEQALLPAITADANKYPGLGRTNSAGNLTFPDNGNDAAKYFQVGLYRTELPVVVDEAGDLTIGISKERTTPVVGDDWIVVDNFRLTYYGPAIPDAINSVETTENGNSAIYNLQGQKLTAPVKGVNIINGKKVVVK